MKELIIPLIAIMFILTGCGTSASDNHTNDGTSENHQHESASSSGNHHEQAAEHTHESGVETLHLSSEKQKEWNIETIPVEMRDLQAKIQLPGIVVLNQNRTADISSYVAGKVTGIKTDLGSRVQKGDALAVINSPEFAQAQAAFLEARSVYMLSRLEYDRAKMLLEEKAIEKKEHDRREAAYQQASTKYGALGSALHSYGIDHAYIEEMIKKCEFVESQPYKCEVADPFLPIVSPISGTIVFRNIIIGEHIKPEKTIFTITDLNRLWVQLDAYEKDLPHLSTDGEVRIQTSVYGDEIFPGRITYISDVIDEQLRTVTVRVEVENKRLKLKPNMYVRGVIPSPAVHKQLAVPENALQSLGEEKIVFIQTGPGVFSIRRVEIRDHINGWATVRSGLKSGETIVTEGAFTLKSELSKGTFGHAHAH